MSGKHLHLAVVGHTNTGKTSMVRTLLRHPHFGEVKDQAGTTRCVSAAPLYIDQKPAITLYDSPGLENAPDVYDWLAEHASTQRHQGLDRVRVLLDDVDARTRFRQETTVLELVIGSDLAFYVCDAREPVLEKYRDELSLLSSCGKPVVVVLNFVASAHSQQAQWQKAMAELGQHHVLAFDAMVRDPATERRLFEKARILLDHHTKTIDAWLNQREREEVQRLDAALLAIAALLVDVADRVWVVENNENTNDAIQAMQAAVKAREQACVDLLLDLYRFERSDYFDEPLMLSAGRWLDDLFDGETLKAYGIRAGQYVGTGAGIGAMLDVATGGLSLGAGTLTGAAVGGAASVWSQFGDVALSRLRGQVRLQVDEPTLRLLTWRQMALLRALRTRGHASQKPLSLPAKDQWEQQKRPNGLIKRRWSQQQRETHVAQELAQAFVED